MRKLLLIGLIISGFLSSAAQEAAPIEVETDSTTAFYADSLLSVVDEMLLIQRPAADLPGIVFLPAVYTGYDRLLPSTDSLFRLSPDAETPAWLQRAIRSRIYANRLIQTHAINHTGQVPYNFQTMAAPPKKYVATADPTTAATIFEEIGAVPGKVDTTKPSELATSEIKKQHWLNKFSTLIQFSQAFVSPNWYQGGNNSLNLLADFQYTSKLNTKFHPKLMFENYFQWRTAMTRTPDDEYRDFSFTENRFQISSKFGYKAFYTWYYSMQALLKTPIFNGYKSGTMTRTASLFSPGEFNLGIGLTYNVKSKNDKFNLSLSLSPISYNLKTCIDKEIDETTQGIERGHKTYSTIGSSIEANWNWQICYNVSWKSRVFFFTNYEKYQYDWQNQFAFKISRWFSANLTLDARYDSTMHKTTQWYKAQLYELFSLGFSYSFNH